MQRGLASMHRNGVRVKLLHEAERKSSVAGRCLSNAPAKAATPSAQLFWPEAQAGLRWACVRLLCGVASTFAQHRKYACLVPLSQQIRDCER